MGRASKYFVGFVGQSLNINPAPPGAYPDLLMASYPHIAWKNFGIGGASWTVLLSGAGLADGRPQSSFVNPYAKAGTTAILICVGGTADIHSEANTAAQVYADNWAYTDAARTAGFDVVIATTITPASYITGGEETIRVAANALIMGDASAKFDYKVAVAAVSGLDTAAAPNYANEAGTYVHWTTAGATLAAAAVKTTLDTIIASGDR